MKKLWMTLFVVAIVTPPSFANHREPVKKVQKEFVTKGQVEREALQKAKEKRADLNALASQVDSFFKAVNDNVTRDFVGNQVKWSDAKKTISDCKQVLKSFRPIDPNRIVKLGIVRDFAVSELMQEVDGQKRESGLLDDRLAVQRKIQRLIETSSEQISHEIAKVLGRIPSDQEIKDLAELKAHEINLCVLKNRVEKITIPKNAKTSVWPNCSK